MTGQENSEIKVVILMGVSGCGKTTIGQSLANQLGWLFIESDDYHSEEDVHKMANGIPLTDEDRWPWIKRLHLVLHEHIKQDQSLVLACSALKESYRRKINGELSGIHYVYMKGDFGTIQERMVQREDHYMKANMLQSQFDVLEEPADAIIVDITQSPENIVKEILDKLITIQNSQPMQRKQDYL